MRKRSGFTLIELMVVVAIIAILAAIAIPQYRKFQLRSKTVEAKENIGAIVTAEEGFAAEHGQYAQCSKDPTGKPGPAKQAWVSKNGKGFDLIGFKPAGDVYYVYGVTKYTATASHDATTYTTDTSITNGQITNGVNMTSNDDIIIAATGDLDGDGTKGSFYRTDENTQILGDPVDTGTNVF